MTQAPTNALSAWHEAKRAHGRAQLEAFAEALSETGDVATAAKAIGVTRQRGSQILGRIREGLGWQAG